MRTPVAWRTQPFIWRNSDAQRLLFSKLMSFLDNNGLLIQALHVLSALANHPHDNRALNHRHSGVVPEHPILIHPQISGILNCLVEVNKAILALDSFRL
jgi:hypothetical protein